MLINIGPETEQMEYKKSIGELKEAIISIAAILNKHQEGELFFGVKNDGTVVGQEIGEESLRKVSQAIENHIRPLIYPVIKVKELGDRKVISVKFSGNRRPYTAYHIPRIRVADRDLAMEQGAYEDMIRSRDDVNHSWERKVSKYTVSDIDEKVFQDYLRRAKEAGRIELEDLDTKSVLDKLGLTEGEHLLNAGAALFCDCGINELQMAKFASKERLTFTDIRRFTGSIMELKKKAEQYIIDAMDWRVEIGDGFARKEIPEVPVAAIREAITNSFGHKLFESGQSNEIAVFKDRIEIYNPGNFPTGHSPEAFIEGRERPIRRNPLITRTLYYSKDMESFATGLKRIKIACIEAGCRVEFENKLNGFVVVFYRDEGKNVQENEILGQNGAQENELLGQNSTQENEILGQNGAQENELLGQNYDKEIICYDSGQLLIEEHSIQFSKQDSYNRMEGYLHSIAEIAILEFCNVPRSKKEIMEHLGYKSITSVKKIIQKLLQEDRLVMTNPDKPRSRNQKYVVKNNCSGS